MSMENAILELAAAMRENTAALIKASEATIHSTESYKAAMHSYNSASALVAQDPVDTKAAELAAATEKRATAAREAQQKDAVANAEREEAEDNQADAGEQAAKDMEESVRKVEEAAQAESAPLDYAKDVKPVLLALVKAKQKPALVDLLTKYNAKNGEQIKADDFVAIVADANALIAA